MLTKFLTTFLLCGALASAAPVFNIKVVENDLVLVNFNISSQPTPSSSGLGTFTVVQNGSSYSWTQPLFGPSFCDADFDDCLPVSPGYSFSFPFRQFYSSTALFTGPTSAPTLIEGIFAGFLSIQNTSVNGDDFSVLNGNPPVYYEARTLSGIPEPSAWVLALSGFAVMAGLRRRIR